VRLISTLCAPAADAFGGEEFGQVLRAEADAEVEVAAAAAEARERQKARSALTSSLRTGRRTPNQGRTSKNFRKFPGFEFSRACCLLMPGEWGAPAGITPAPGLCVAACRQKKRTRFPAAVPVNGLVEARHRK
jgi:hypothetical protein